MADPRFTFVVPTRNRSGLLRRALTSALGQGHGDFEVLVSDNHSDDDTPDVVEEFAGDARVRAVRTPHALAQPESWEFAFAHARGEWVTLLSDDDAVVGSLLQRVEAVLDGTTRVVAYGKAWYVHPGVDPPWPHPREVNVVTARPWSGAVEDVPARPELERFFARAQREAIPGISNAFVHRDVLGRLEREAGRLFRYPDPAAVACAGFLALEPSYRAIDLPLNVEGVSRTNVSSGYRHRLEQTHSLVREYHADELFELVPLRSRTMANCEAESLLQARAHLPGRIDDMEIAPVPYFLAVHDELSRRGRKERRQDLAEWREVLRRQPTAVRRTVLAAVARRRARTAVRKVPAATPLRRLLPTGETPAFFAVRGDEAGFVDIVGACAYLDGWIDRAPDGDDLRAAAPSLAAVTGAGS